MNLKTTLIISTLWPFAMASAGVSTSSSAPTSDILSSMDSGGTGIDTALKDEDSDADHARGQLFALGDGAGTDYQISAITLKKSSTQSYLNDTITLRVFEGTSAQWDSGTGHSTAVDGDDYYVGTSVTPLYTEVFTLNGSYANNDYVTFELATPLTVSESSDFGYFMTYDQVDGTEDRFQHREESNGGRVTISDSDHIVSSRNQIYYVHGTAGDGGTVEPAEELTISTSEPADAILGTAVGTSWTRAVHGGGTVTKTTRGNTFLMPDTGTGYPGYQVTGLTIQKDTDQSFESGDTLQLWIFAWDPADDGNDGSVWTQSGTNGSDDGDPLSGTGMTAMLVDTYDLAGLSIDDDAFVTFNFSASPLYLAENRSYGFLIGYIDGAGSPSAYFQYAQPANNAYADGMQIRTQNIPSENTYYSPWDTDFFVRGSAIDATMYGTDSDDDGLSDVWEFLHFQGLGETDEDDPDDDGVDNAAEQTAGTDPNEADSDSDGLDDAVEIAGPTDPLDSDSDDDGLSDGVETNSGRFVSSSDTGTDPMLSDTDDDGVNDRIEISLGTDPFDGSHLPADRPNIIFIMIDDADINEIGVYGQATLQTPRVDTMASQGLMFTDYYTASPVCHSCRSCLMTGQDSRRSQDRFNNGDGTGYQYPLAAERVTIGEVLQQAGYTTGCVGKWGMGGPTTTGAPWNQGFDFFCGYLGQVQAHDAFPKYLWKNDQKIYFNEDQLGPGDSLYIAGAENFNTAIQDWDDPHGNVASHDVVVAEGLQFIEDNADKPFFLYCAWTPPHAHNFPAATVEALTDADGLVYDTLDLDQTLINEMYPGMPFGESATHPGYPEYESHTYASMLSATDRDTGRIMDKLVELGIDDRTLVIFCSDNGESGDSAIFLTEEHLKEGYANLRGAKKDTYEGGIRSPFVAWWPGTISPGTTSGVIGTFADMLPTFAEIAGVSTPTQITGRSILPVLYGGGEENLVPRDYHYWSFREYSNGLNRRWRAVRQGDWKIVRDRVNDGSAPTYELFNLADDLYETTDLSATEPEVLARLIPLVEGTHEVALSPYFRADDEFFTLTNLTASAYQTGTPDGSGASNGYSLTPNGTGSGFNYLPFETGLSETATFTWTLEFPSGGAASLLLGGVNDAGSCLAVRVDADAGTVEVSHAGAWAASGGFDGGNSAECQLRIDPMSGSGELVIGSTVLPFELATAPGALRFWGYQVESETVRASRPRWQVGTIGSGAFQAMEGGGVFDMFYQIPFSVGQSITPQYSTGLDAWYNDPPGLLEIRSTNSQGKLEGTWSLPSDSLLPRQNDRMFLRSAIDP
ncbi:MAG: sulfatase-like hydrolase/transferase [Verrucomicrobiota bacterium JB025]|nr:sulfatase-like hydrolase/transferase [Verrucomicrobiota bacterium JB025]